MSITSAVSAMGVILSFIVRIMEIPMLACGIAADSNPASCLFACRGQHGAACEVEKDTQRAAIGWEAGGSDAGGTSSVWQPCLLLCWSPQLLAIPPPPAPVHCSPFLPPPLASFLAPVAESITHNH
jgi:hypothetical protein